MMTAPQRLRTAVACLGVSLLLVQQAGRTEPPPPDALKFFKNYFVTVDYVVAGVGLEGMGVNGIASSSINMTGVPANAEALAAFLYWQVVSADGSDAGADERDVQRTGPELARSSRSPRSGGPLAVVGDPGGTSPCWSSGGGTGVRRIEADVSLSVPTCCDSCPSIRRPAPDQRRAHRATARQRQLEQHAKSARRQPGCDLSESGSRRRR